MENQKKKILMKMADPYLGTLLAHKLRSDGYEVVEIKLFDDLVGAAKNAKPDLVLLDLSGPNGEEAAHEFMLLEKDEATMKIPVIVFSTHEHHPEHFHIMKQLGAADVLSRDVDLKKFAERIKTVLQ